MDCNEIWLNAWELGILLSKAEVFNRGTATPWGSLKSLQVCCQIFVLKFFLPPKLKYACKYTLTRIQHLRKNNNLNNIGEILTSL